MKNNRSTRKRRSSSSRRRDGWICIEIRGEPFERGFSHGQKLYKEIARVKHRLSFILKKELGSSLSYCIEFTNSYIKPVVKNKYAEIYEEIRGISAGAKSRGVDISIDALLVWNSLMTLYSFLVDGGGGGGGGGAPAATENQQRCSAFISTGAATSHGDIVMAHNSHVDFPTGQLFNIILRVIPTHGIPFIMQTGAGMVFSSTDWFITDAGIIGCETTIAGIKNKPHVLKSPIFCRVRQAMQYGKTIDEYISYLKTDNSGDYSCSWLFGNTNTGEIARVELGINNISVERTKSGAFIGMNGPIDTDFRYKETTNVIGFDDIHTSIGARRVRLEELVYDKYYGKITTSVAKKIISDHYDIFKERDMGPTSSLSICKHVERDGDAKHRPYDLRGVYDGKVVDSKMAQKGRFLGRFGSSCGRTFSIKRHIREHPEYKEYEGMVDDIVGYPWVLL